MRLGHGIVFVLLTLLASLRAMGADAVRIAILAGEGERAPKAGVVDRLSSDRRLHVSAVRHSAGIEVDEAGTTAWAGTTVHMKEGPPPSPPVFLADHPFLFFILEKSSGTILFMGRVANP